MLCLLISCCCDGWKFQINRTKWKNHLVSVWGSCSSFCPSSCEFHTSSSAAGGLVAPFVMGWQTARCRGREFAVLGSWEALLMVKSLFLSSIFVTNSLSLNFHHLKLVYFTLSFLLSAAQLVIITLYFSCWVFSFFSSLLLCDVALARNTFPFFQTKKNPKAKKSPNLHTIQILLIKKTMNFRVKKIINTFEPAESNYHFPGMQVMPLFPGSGHCWIPLGQHPPHPGSYCSYFFYLL